MLRFNGRVVLVTGAGGGEYVKAGGRVSSSLSCWEPPAPTFCFVLFFPLVGITHAAIAAVPASGLRAAVTRRLGERLIGLGGGGGGSGRTDNDSSLVAESPEGGEVGLASLEWGPRNSCCSSPHLHPPGPSRLGSGEDRGQAGLPD